MAQNLPVLRLPEPFLLPQDEMACDMLRTMSRVDAWYMVQRRTADAGIEAAIDKHSFRAIGITDYMENGGDITIAQRMAGQVYDRRDDEVSFSEIERVGI